MMTERKDKLFTHNYFYACITNFLLFFCFYLLMPVLALYLIDTFQAPKSMIGAILSCYTVAALVIRPFSGFLLDTFARKPLYLVSLFFFIVLFAGYPLATSVALFAVFRVLHGFAFGSVSVAGNTIVIDIMPSSRRGEGLGYYGLSNNIAMAIGPMTGMYLYDHYSYNVIFYTSFVIGIIAFIMGSRIKTASRCPVPREAISLDRFVLLKGIPAGINLLLIAIPYGITTTYIALYAQELHISGKIGFFYCAMAIGIALSRLFSGKQVDRGRLTSVIALGMGIAMLSFLLLAVIKLFSADYPVLTQDLFYFTALLIGLGYGSIFPAMNSLFIALAPNNQRGTANSTYLVSWDIGIGIGLLLGGILSEASNFSVAFISGGVLNLIAVWMFIYFTGNHFKRNRIN
jgi:MFS family permease